CAPRGVELDKFIYQSGRQITVEGQTSRQELIYSFIGNLKEQPVFRKVVIQNQNPESRGNRTNFTVKFDYTEAPK
ncbi:MAG: PilN domain-containing protein, partial [Planctomycetes bacterium]|nr:PilN domain-containing protein [Planctomycetota bacterium]